MLHVFLFLFPPFDVEFFELFVGNFLWRILWEEFWGKNYWGRFWGENVLEKSLYKNRHLTQSRCLRPCLGHFSSRDLCKFASMLVRELRGTQTNKSIPNHKQNISRMNPTPPPNIQLPLPHTCWWFPPLPSPFCLEKT